MYANAHDGWLPPVGYLDPNTGSVVGPYWFEEIMTTMGRTPASYQPDGMKDLGYWRCPENFQAVRPASSKAGDPYNSYTINGYGPGAPSPEYRYMGSKLAWMKWSSDLYAMWDGSFYKVEAWNDDGIQSVPTAFVAGRGVRQTSYRHRLGINMLFADGHVAWLGGPLEYRGPGPGTGTLASQYVNGHVWHCY